VQGEYCDVGVVKYPAKLNFIIEWSEKKYEKP
jgi:hypothetical protein